MKLPVHKHVMFIFLLSVMILLAQVSALGQITGIITDSKTGKPLNGVEVFINKTTIATQSDDIGQFNLENVLTGFQEIVLYKKGYALYKSSMRIQSGRAYNLKLTLNAQKKQKSTTLKAEEKELLKTKIAGKGNENAISFINEEEIGTTLQEEKKVFTSTSLLTIQNNTLGYQMNYYLMELPMEEISAAHVRYEQIFTAEMQQTIEWEKRRKEYFAGTQRHWLMALTNHRLKEEGYRLTYENGKEIEDTTLITNSSIKDYKTLNIEKPITIQFNRVNNKEEIGKAQTSGPVEVSTTGVPLNAKALTIEGDIVNKGLAWELPLEYQPIAGNVEDTYAQTLEKLYEKVYVHTDKPYYYPGEPMWFKGYIHYKEPKWRDSLSKVMYVELINPKKEITLTKTLKIDSGTFHNDFILPDTLKAGIYYLRAYTNLNRNFGDSSLFVKPIPILNITDKVEYTQSQKEETPKEENPQIVITPDKQSYKPREKITLTIQTKDNDGKPMAANLSLSVTDAVQVVPIEEPATIINRYNEKEGEKQRQKKIIDIKFPVEYGVGLSGRFLNDRGKPERTTLTILQMKPRNMMMTTTDENGIFSAGGFDFYDSAIFTIKSDKAKDQPYGKVELLPRETPPMNFKESDKQLLIQNTQSPQRIISEYEVPKDVRMLQNVEVRATRIEEEYKEDYRIKRPYGVPDYIINKKDINTGNGNLLLSLQGRVPGLVVRQVEGGNWVVYTQRAFGTSAANAKEVTVTVNDVFMNGTPESILRTLDPNTIESIEVKLGVNVLYGGAGGNGIVAVYLKQGTEETDHNTNVSTLKVPGYSLSRKFNAPAYNDPKTDKTIADYRSTIYWNPNVVTDHNSGTTTLSFFAADLPGKYRVVLEAVTEKNEAVRSVYYLSIEEER
jgi:hypothetical protein